MVENEYLVDVIIDKEKCTLKTFATNHYFALDAMIDLASVDKVFKIYNTEKKTSWDINKELAPLREAKKTITNMSEYYNFLKEEE